MKGRKGKKIRIIKKPTLLCAGLLKDYVKALYQYLKPTGLIFSISGGDCLTKKFTKYSISSFVRYIGAIDSVMTNNRITNRAML